MPASNRFDNLLMARFAAVLLISACILLSFAALVRASLLHPTILLAAGLILLAGLLIWRGIGTLREVDWLALIAQHPDTSYAAVLVSTIMLIGLFLLGALWWVLLLGGGQITFRVEDWEFHYQYYHLLREALTTREIPYFASHTLGTFGYTNRLFAIPEVPLSPQVLLLGITDVRGFLVFNAILMYSACYAAGILFWRRYHLSVLSFAFLLFAFSLNGYVTSHVGVGHTAWFGYLLFPYLVYGVMQIVEGEKSVGNSIKIGVMLLLLGLQGSIHMVAWWTLFLGILAIWHRSLFIPAISSMVIGLILYAPRILPVLTSYADYSPEFIGGYRSVDQVVEAFVVTRDAFYLPSTNIIFWWEYDFYFGVVGFGLLIFFGIFKFWQNSARYEGWRRLIGPLTIMALLSMNFFYEVLRALPIPLISGQRVTSRILALPIAFIIAIAAIGMQRWLESQSNRRVAITGMCIAIVLMASDLYQHLVMWSLPRLELVWNADESAPIPHDLLGASAAVTAQDQLYVKAVDAMPLVGAASLLIAAGVAFVLVQWQRRAITASR